MTRAVIRCSDSAVSRRGSRSAPMGAVRSAARRPASRLDSRSYPQTALTFNLAHSAAASRHLDRIPHRDRPVHPGAAARTALEPGVRGRSRRRPSPRDALRRRAGGARSSAARIRSWARSRSSPVAASFRWRSRPRRVCGAGRVVLIGEAAHVMPPIGAQGLNLGLRDAATIGELVVAAQRDGGDVGGELAARYEHMRRADVTSRSLGGRSAQPQPACRIFCRCKARAGSDSICWTGSARCAARSCARASRRRHRSRG